LNVAHDEGLGTTEDLFKIEEMLSGIYQRDASEDIDMPLRRPRSLGRGTGEFTKRRQDTKAEYSDSCFLDLPATAITTEISMAHPERPPKYDDRSENEQDYRQHKPPTSLAQAEGPLTRSRKRRIKAEDSYITRFSVRD
jgi:hypothetical protein